VCLCCAVPGIPTAICEPLAIRPECQQKPTLRKATRRTSCCSGSSAPHSSSAAPISPASPAPGKDEDYDYDVFDGDRKVGRIYRVNAHDEIWFWGVSFLLTNRKSYGHAPALDAAKAAFKASMLPERAAPADRRRESLGLVHKAMVLTAHDKAEMQGEQQLLESRPCTNQ
jgi:hypothetical protein